MTSTTDFLAAWRHQLGLSGPGSGSRGAKVGFLLAVAAGADLAEPIRQLGLYATPAKPLGEQTRDHLNNHLSGDPDAAATLRQQLGELVPVEERP